jgi:hypothetical protein
MPATQLAVAGIPLFAVDFQPKSSAVFNLGHRGKGMNQTLQKETKAQRAERLKREKNPWAVFDEVRAFAREGRSSVVPEWASFYFKWWGIYTQGDGIGATGGKSSAPLPPRSRS